MNIQLQSHIHIMKRIRNSLRSDSLFLFGALMLTNMVAHFYQMLLARMMSPADYGILVTLLSLSYVLIIFMRSFQARIIKAISESRDANPGEMRALFFATLRTLALLGAAVFIAHWLACRWVADFLHIGTTTPVIMLGLYTLSTFLAPVPRGMLLGLNRLRVTGIVEILEPVARLAVGIALVTWGLGVNGALIGYAVGNVALFTVALVPLWPLLRRDGDRIPSVDDFAVLDRYTLLVLAINASLMVMASVDQIAIKHFFSAEVAGNYAVAFLLGQIIAMTANCLGLIIFARSANMPLEVSQRARLLIKGVLAIGSIAVSLTVGFLIAPELAVGLMGGSQYDTAHAYVGLVGIEMTIFAFIYIQAYFLIAAGVTQIVWPLGLALALEIALLARYHATVQQVLINLILVMGGLLVCVSVFSWRILERGASQLSEVP